MIISIKIVDGPEHFMCINCHEKNYNIQNIDKNTKNIKDNDFGLSDFESDVTIINDKNVTKKKIFCQICFKDHVFIQDNEIEQKKNLIQRVVNYGGGKFKCCKGKCNIF